MSRKSLSCFLSSSLQPVNLSWCQPSPTIATSEPLLHQKVTPSGAKCDQHRKENEMLDSKKTLLWCQSERRHQVLLLLVHRMWIWDFQQYEPVETDYWTKMSWTIAVFTVLLKTLHLHILRCRCNGLLVCFVESSPVDFLDSFFFFLNISLPMFSLWKEEKAKCWGIVSCWDYCLCYVMNPHTINVCQRKLSMSQEQWDRPPREELRSHVRQCCVSCQSVLEAKWPCFFFLFIVKVVVPHFGKYAFSFSLLG